MQKIKRLSSDLIAKIAAGEVVERPASVVKELIENSLDAGASFVRLEIEKSGLKKISVLDNGQGMDKEDLLVCFLPHTTSKLELEDDLVSIATLGFRGEALNSIAAVSDMTIKSKLADQPTGYQVQLKNAKVQESQPVGMADGTEVVVENLFQNTPARKKFLSSPNTEFYHLLSLVSRLALSFPQVGFSLIHNGKNVLQLPKDQSAPERVRTLLGERIHSQLIPLTFQNEKIQLKGFIGTPVLATKAKNKQFLFVNNRQVRHHSLSQAVKEAFGTLLETKAYPLFLLYLDLPTDLIDVNVHPRKEEIKFMDQTAINSLVKQAIQTVLGQKDLTYRPFSLENAWENEELQGAYGALLLREDSNENDSYAAGKLRADTSFWQVKNDSPEEEILQINKMYLIAPSKTGLHLIDQHAAHEKILFEQLLQTFQQTQKEVVTLPAPVVFDLPSLDIPLMQEKLAAFNQLGFDLEPFGRNSFKVSQVPKIFQQRDIASLIAEVLDDLSEEKTNLPLDLLTEKTLAFLACKSAIKAGDYLSQEERKKLLEKLQNTTSAYTCPHGRPVQIEISLSELDRLFKRK